MIDLHLHSEASDGIDSPSYIIDLASEKKLKAIALTDHDTIDGIKEFLQYGEDKKIIVISGIEISIKHDLKRDIKDVHIIGLNIDHNANILNKKIKLQKEGRQNQKKEICKRLNEEFGYDISFEEVKNIAKSSSIGRPHIVDVLIKNNPTKVKNKTKNELFKMISLGGKAYVDREFEFTLEESIELISNTGGIPILAHPGIYNVVNKKKFIQLCIQAGIKGIEIQYTYDKNRPYFGTNKAEWALKSLPEYFNKIANDYKLIKSGGSDYHGNKKDIIIGEAKVPDKYLLNIL
ncbi:MAG: PHP domain-containing protein [Candidatus Lokiarchaeota archaeon]|nr:PHP domain-containing protein [Candidatus Lokiarchaeota archaeon]